jgi:hypothetical protein
MSVCAKGVSRGVHNIAFSVSPDRFRAFDFVLFFSSFALEGANLFWLQTTIEGRQERLQTDIEEC